MDKKWDLYLDTVLKYGNTNIFVLPDFSLIIMAVDTGAI